jgi:hypothetical protein
VKLLTINVDIADGKIVPLEPDKMPRNAKGILTVLADSDGALNKDHTRVRLPLIAGNGKNFINPSKEQLDESAWGD